MVTAICGGNSPPATGSAGLWKGKRSSGVTMSCVFGTNGMSLPERACSAIPESAIAGALGGVGGVAESRVGERTAAAHAERLPGRQPAEVELDAPRPRRSGVAHLHEPARQVLQLQVVDLHVEERDAVGERAAEQHALRARLVADGPLGLDLDARALEREVVEAAALESLRPCGEQRQAFEGKELQRYLGREVGLVATAAQIEGVDAERGADHAGVEAAVPQVRVLVLERETAAEAERPALVEMPRRIADQSI